MTEHIIRPMNEAEKRYADDTGTVWVRWNQSKRMDILMIAIGLLIGQVVSFGHQYAPALTALGVLAVALYLKRSRGRDEG